MDIFNAKSLPQELVSICYHYACQTNREFNIVSCPRDPFVILGILASKRLNDLSKSVWILDGGSWQAANELRAARLRAIHIPKFTMISRGYINQARQGWRPTLKDMWGDEYQQDDTPSHLPEQCEDIFECDDPAPIEEAQIPEMDEATFGIIGELGLINHTPSLFDSTGAFGTVEYYQRTIRKNPFATIAENHGILWKDRRGHIWRYLRLGQAMRFDLLEAVLSPVEL